jgi:hypothetical protein
MSVPADNGEYAYKRMLTPVLVNGYFAKKAFSKFFRVLKKVPELVILKSPTFSEFWEG